MRIYNKRSCVTSSQASKVPPIPKRLPPSILKSIEDSPISSRTRSSLKGREIKHYFLGKKVWFKKKNTTLLIPTRKEIPPQKKLWHTISEAKQSEEAYFNEVKDYMLKHCISLDNALNELCQPPSSNDLST